MNTLHNYMNRQRRQLLMASGGFFLAFLVYSYYVAREYLIRFDFDVMVRLQNNIPLRIDPYFSSFSLLGSPELLGIMLLIFVFIAGLKKKRRWLIVFMYPAFHVVEIIGKSIIDQTAPPFMFHRYAFDFHFPSTYVSTEFYSYPSGHAGRTAFMASFFAYVVYSSKITIWLKLIFWAILAFIFIVMFVSRVSLGEHWISDVIGGVLLGFAFGLLSAVLW